jgi:biopolymer transport protein ExbB
MELLTVLKTGGIAMWIIAFFSVLAVAVAVERALALWRFSDKAKSLADAVTRSILRGDVEDARAQAERSSSPAAEVFLAALVPTAPGKRPVTDARIDAAVERQRQEAN